MTGICDSVISQDLAVDCANPLVRGVEPDGVIMNRGDVDFAKSVMDENNKNIIKTLLLKAGKKAYAVQQQGANPFTGTQTSLVVGTYRNTFTNEVAIAVLDNGPEVAQNIIDGLANGTYLLILRNKHKGADGRSEYQVYGYYQGLKASAIANEKYSEDTDGGWLVTLQETSVPKSALFYFNTDAATTATQFEALKTEAAASGE